MRTSYNYLKKNSIYFLIFLPIVLKSVTKVNFEIFFQNTYSIFISINIFLSFLITSLGFKYFFKLKINLSFSYVLFLLFNFCLSTLFVIFGLNFDFIYFVLTTFIFFNITYLIYEKKKLLKLLQFINLIVLIIVNQKQLSKKFMYDRFEIAGDVYNFIVPNVEKIFNSNLIYVYQNPVFDYGFFHINYSLLGNFYFAYLSKLHNLFGEFDVVSYIPYTLFLLSILFIFELNTTFRNKFFLTFLHVLILIINDWIRYQFVDSYLLEGFACLFFAIIFFGIFDFDSQKNIHKNFIYFLIGFFIFSKFFINLHLIFYILKKRKIFDLSKIYFLIGIFCYVYIFYVFPPKNSRDLITGFNFDNVKGVLQYWSEDRLLIYVVVFEILFLVYKFYKRFPITKKIKNILLLNFINLTLIFILYIFIWSEGVELESSYRYFLQLYFLNIYMFVETIPEKFSLNDKVKKKKSHNFKFLDFAG